MTIREVSREDFAAVFGQNAVRDGSYSYYLTTDSIGIRKDLRNNSIEVVGSDYDKSLEDQLEKDILNTICGDFRGYDLEPTNEPVWEWEEKAKPNILLYYFPQIAFTVILLLIVLFYYIAASK